MYPRPKELSFLHLYLRCSQEKAEHVHFLWWMYFKNKQKQESTLLKAFLNLLELLINNILYTYIYIKIFCSVWFLYIRAKWFLSGDGQLLPLCNKHRDIPRDSIYTWDFFYFCILMFFKLFNGSNCSSKSTGSLFPLGPTELSSKHGGVVG